jgi:hypothetical protein
MSVLIKDLDMPKSCFECDFNRGEYGRDCYEKCSCTLTSHQMNLKDYKCRPKECPLVEVATPHGGLIDGDKLYREVAKAHAYEHLSVKRIIAMVRNSSTVIGAEE